MMVSVVRTDEGGLYKEKKVTLIDSHQIEFPLMKWICIRSKRIVETPSAADWTISLTNVFWPALIYIHNVCLLKEVHFILKIDVNLMTL